MSMQHIKANSRLAGFVVGERVTVRAGRMIRAGIIVYQVPPIVGRVPLSIVALDGGGYATYVHYSKLARLA